MGTRLLLLCVICQMVSMESLGVKLPLSDLKGKVTPIKPKPFPASAVSSPVTKTKSLTCDDKDLNSKLFSSIPLKREFSLPLAFTSSSWALPVPKIDSSSIADVKLPDRLRQKLVSSKLFNPPIRNAKPETGIPDVSFPYKYPFLSYSTKPPNALPAHSSCDMHSSSLNKISSLSNVKSLPIVPVKPLKITDTDAICSASKSNNVFAQPGITPLSISRTSDSPLALEARKPSFSEQLNSNTFSSSTPCSSPFPFYYESMFLPRVKTPSEMSPLNFRPISFKAAGNIDFPSLSASRNLLNPKTLTSDTSINSHPGRNGPYLSTFYSNPMKTAEIPNPSNTIQLPKSSSNVPVSRRPVFSAQTAAAKKLWPPLEANSGSASVAFESTIKQPEFLPSPVLKDCSDPKMLSYSMPCSLADKISDFKFQPSTPLKIKPSAFGPHSNFLNSPATSLVPVSSSLPIVDVLSNKLNNAGSLKNINAPHMFPIIGACVETIENIHAHNPSCNCQSCVDFVPTLQRINLASPCAPILASYQHPLFTEERVIKPSKYSPPIIPLEPIPTISFGSPTFSPTTYLPSKTSQMPSSISYVNQSPSVTQCTAKMVSSINDLVTNIAQNILSSYKSYIDSASQNISSKLTIQLNPYNNPEFILKQTAPAFPLPQGNPVNKQSILPVIIPKTDCINLPLVDSSTIICSDAPCKLSAFEVSCSQPILICPTQPIATVLPSTPLITYSPPLCPSQLPSPSLPSYPTIASPLCMEAPVFKVSSSKKDSEMEKLIELMLLADILNNDESFDLDELDTLLAFLSVS